TLHRADRVAGGVLQRGGRARYPKIPDQLRRQFRYRRGGKAFQSARDNRRRDRDVSKQDAGRAISLIHVLGDRRVGLPAWHLRHGSEGTAAVDVFTLRRGTPPSLRSPRSPLRLATARPPDRSRRVDLPLFDLTDP